MLLYYLLKSARPRQWTKNFSVFAPLLFSGWLFTFEKVTLAIWAFFLFCLLSSSVYFINDLIDRPQDRLHPFKKLRPIASGKLDPRLALTIAVGTIFLVLIWSFQFKLAFSVAVAAFIVLQLSYSLFIKEIILLDVMAIAASFVIRVYAGAFIISAHINVWFLLAVVSTSLFLAIAKRRSELTLLRGQEVAGQHRITLSHYPETLLQSLTTMFATASWITYALFTFNYPTPRPNERLSNFLSDYLPSTLEQSKWLMISIPFVLYGVMRYLYIVYEKKEGESPERVVLSDTPLLATGVLWFLSILVVLYGFAAL